MVKIKTTKLNQKGFSYHLLLPIAVIAIVAAIGSYILTRGHALEQTSTAGTNSSIPGPNIIQPYPPTIRQNDKNNTVIALQTMLRGSNLPDGDPVGTFGNGTLADVKALQSLCKITVDGIVGPQTWPCVMTFYSNAKSNHQNGAVPLPYFSLFNQYAPKKDGILFTAKKLPSNCQGGALDVYGMEGYNLSSTASQNWFGGLQVGDNTLLPAVSGPNVIEVNFRCSSADNPRGAFTYVVIQH